jgi:hypothetical protein
VRRDGGRATGWRIAGRRTTGDRPARPLPAAVLLQAVLLAGALGLAMLFAPWAAAQVGTALMVEPQVELSVADDRPLRGAAVRVSVADGAAPAANHEVRAIYRPNSSTSHTETVGRSDASGTLFWTPRDAGPVILEARAPGADPKAAAVATTTVAVRYGTLPARGLGIMVLAGVLLFGGAALGFVMLLRPPSPAQGSEPPST